MRVIAAVYVNFYRLASSCREDLFLFFFFGLKSNPNTKLVPFCGKELFSFWTTPTEFSSLVSGPMPGIYQGMYRLMFFDDSTFLNVRCFLSKQK